MNGALAILPSGLALFMFERVFNQNVWWLPWVVASLLTLMLVGTMRIDELRPLYGYALIQISCFVLGFNKAWSWGIIPYIKSSWLWIEITSLSSIELDPYYMALFRTLLLAAIFIGINIYTGKEPSVTSGNKVYVKKASVFNLDRYGYKTRLLLAFLSANAMLLLVVAAPSLFQYNGVGEFIGGFYSVLQGMRSNITAINSITDVLLSQCGNIIICSIGTENALVNWLANSFVWLIEDCVYVRYFIDLMVYLFIILFG
jgi:hypothetical protein